MARSPFDPRRIRTPRRERLFDEQAPLSPSQVHQLVSGALARHVSPTIHVVGEISDLSRPVSGHLYFTLKDERSELRALMWRSDALRLKFSLEEGMEVIAVGGLDVYAPRGIYQLVVRRVEPRGAGALELAFRQLRDKLAAEGLFDASGKRSLPRLPRRIALVTSPHGAALRDVLRTLERRFPALDVFVFPTRVQGDGAEREIAAAIRDAQSASEALGGIDLLIVTRGGGSAEDLAAFNTEPVARAIHDCRIPTISAVGHEIDVTIADYVADVRAATPTAAAEIATPVRDELLAGIGERLARIERAWSVQRRHGEQALRGVTGSAWLSRPLAVLRRQAQRVDELHAKLRAAWGERWRAARGRLQRGESAIWRLVSGRGVQRAGARLERQLTRLERGLVRGQGSARRRLDERVRSLATLRPDVLLARYAEAVRQAELRAAASHPRQVLRRGFSITRTVRGGKVLRSVSEIRDGARLKIELSDGEFFATGEDPRQGGLFDETK